MGKVLVIKSTEFSYRLTIKKSNLKVNNHEVYGNKKYGHKAFTHALHYCVQEAYKSISPPFLVPITVKKDDIVYYIYDEGHNRTPTSYSDRVFSSLQEAREYWQVVYGNKEYKIPNERGLQAKFSTLLLPTKITGYLNIKHYGYKAYLLTLTIIVFIFMNLYGFYFYKQNFSSYKSSYQLFLENTEKNILFSWSSKPNQKYFLEQCYRNFYRHYTKSPAMGWKVVNAQCTPNSITVKWKYEGDKKEVKKSLSFVYKNIIKGNGNVTKGTIKESLKVQNIRSEALQNNMKEQLNKILGDFKKAKIITKNPIRQDTNKTYSTQFIKGQRIILFVASDVKLVTEYLSQKIPQFIISKYDIAVKNNSTTWKITGELYEK